MKISVDYSRCEGHGLCAAQAPAVFTLDDDAQLIYRFEGADVPDEYVKVARAAVDSCPVAALREQS
ncbi:ferredoxin [Nocardia implantans]|uniref:Ferredoxin n=1 Tax=Nocardia implantans TaxID=3108168 RepID=A0ABU6AWX4_9NOCA|nr:MULTISPECIES: ferredoxin [unclassified Nocardia]MBF6193991.1 ferredoxin [Nocardia beijingensis]MEA3529270.1 ferredoxin [Nocardia sp. CDC192]MEB3511856.1 ferredoxin [Nocardia sp. CDC186]